MSGSKDDQKKVQDNPFPNEQVSPKVKASDAFGIKVARAIMARHNYYNNQTNRIHKIHENRRYAAGRQDIEKYKTRLDAYLDSSNTQSHLNIDWSVHSVGSKMIDVVIGGMINQDYSINLESIDPQSKTAKSKQRDKFFENIIKKKELQAIEEMAGTPLIEYDLDAPETSEEIDIYMEMEYRQPIEIAMEEIINFELYNNDWNLVRNRVIRDMVENNIGSVRVYWDQNNNIRLRYVDISNLIKSYTEDPSYGDTDYEAELDMITIRELRKRAKGSLSEEELFDIAQASATKNENGKWLYGSTFSSSGTYNALEYTYDDFRVQVLDFIFYTTDVHKWESKENKHGGSYFNKKDYGYQKPERSKYDREVIVKEIECSYEGIWVLETNTIIDYKKSRNMLRPSSNSQKITPELIHPYIIFEPNTRAGTSISLVDRMKPSLDAMQLYVLKMRHIIAEAAPPGVSIDVSVLNNLQVGTKDLTPAKAIEMYKQKGILLYDGENDNGDQINRKPIEAMQNGIGDALVPLVNGWMFEMEAIRQITGVNETRDGSQVDSKALVGVEKMKLLASNNATRELYNAFTFGILEKLGHRISRMVQDKMVFGDGLKQYENIIGREGTRSLEFLPSDFSLLELGIKVEAMPTDEDIQSLIADIQRSLDQKELRLEDAIEIRNIPNMKKASRYLIHRRKKYQREQVEAAEQEQQMIAEREQVAGRANAEAQAMKSKAESEAKITTMQAEYELKMQLDDHETKNKITIVDREGYWKERHIEEAESEGDTGPDANNDGDPSGSSKEDKPAFGDGNGSKMGMPKAHSGPRVMSNPASAAKRTD